MPLCQSGRRGAALLANGGGFEVSMNYHQIRLGRELTPFELALQERAKKLNPDLTFVEWNEALVEKRRKALKLPSIYDKMPDIAKCDILRVCILASEEKWSGGVYGDLDVAWMQSLDVLMAHHTAFIGRDAVLGVMNSVLCAPAGHAWVKEVRDSFTGFHYSRIKANWWERVSFPVHRAILEECNFEDVSILEPSVLYPYTLAERKAPMVPPFATYGPETVGVHLYSTTGDPRIAPLPYDEILAALPAV